MKLYSLLDTKAKVYGAPFAAPNDGIAGRLVMEALRDPQSMVAKYPNDFQLYCLGEYDEHTGELVQEKVQLVYEVVVLQEALAAV